MADRHRRTAYSVATCLLLAACGNTSEVPEVASVDAAELAAAGLFSACHGEDDLGLLRLEGATVRLELRDQDARDYGEAINEAMNTPSSGNFAPISEAVSNLSNCLAEEANFPGAPIELEDGDEWDSWRHYFTGGAGWERSWAYESTLELP